MIPIVPVLCVYPEPFHGNSSPQYLFLVPHKVQKILFVLEDIPHFNDQWFQFQGIHDDFSMNIMYNCDSWWIT